MFKIIKLNACYSYTIHYVSFSIFESIIKQKQIKTNLIMGVVLTQGKKFKEGNSACLVPLQSVRGFNTY